MIYPSSKVAREMKMKLMAFVHVFWGKKIQTIFPPSKAARETKIKSMAFVGGEVIGLYENLLSTSVAVVPVDYHRYTVGKTIKCQGLPDGLIT